MKISDTLIIGGGPAGLYASFYAGLRGMSVQLVEHHTELGGKLNIYPEKIVWDIGGIPPAPAEVIKQQMVEQAMTFNPEVHVSTTCDSIRQHDGCFETITDKGSFFSRTLIIASGRGIFTPVRLDVEGADTFELTNLHYTVKRMDRFKDRHVLISGAGNTAVDWAEALSGIAASVSMVYRSGEMKGHEAMIAALYRKDNIRMHPQSEIESLVANDAGDAISQVRLTSGASVEVDDVLISHGYESNCEFLETFDSDFEYNEHRMIQTSDVSDTPIPGIFACGDQVDYDGKVRLIAGCFTEAAQAANHAKTFLRADAPEEGMVSSHNDVFKEKNKELLQKFY